MDKAKEISALWSQIKPQIGELVRLCHEIESHAEDTSEAYRRGYETAKHECEDCKINIGVEAIRKEAYEKAYEQGRKDGKIEGQAETWVCVKKIALHPEEGGIARGDIRKIFGCHHFQTVFRDCSASECIEKIRAYEQEKEEQIQVGDEVKNTQTDARFIVTHMWVNNSGEKGVSGFNYECSAFSTALDLVRKTGRHFPEIAEVMQKMKEK